MRWSFLSEGFALRNARAWVSLVLGVIMVGSGVGLMLDGGLGVSPGDVLFSGLAHVTGWSVGLMVVASYLIFVLVTWPVGIRPGPGTLACIVLIGPSVDATRVLTSAIVDFSSWPMWALVAWWVLGLVVFTAGVVGLFAAQLGVSPYDQLTQAVHKLTRRSLGFARLVTDGTCFCVGVLLGGSWGVGTVVLLVCVPLALNRVLPAVRRFVSGSRP